MSNNHKISQEELEVFIKVIPFSSLSTMNNVRLKTIKELVEEQTIVEEVKEKVQMKEISLKVFDIIESYNSKEPSLLDIIASYKSEEELSNAIEPLGQHADSHNGLGA